MSISGAEATVIAGIVGAGSALLSASLATFGTYKVTNRSIRSQEERARQERLAEAYIDLQWFVFTEMSRVNNLREPWRLSPVELLLPNVNESPVEDSADELRIMSRVRLVGGPIVRARLSEWSSSVVLFRLAVWNLDRIAGNLGPRPLRLKNVPADVWQPQMHEMHEIWAHLHTQASALEKAMRGELTGQLEPELADHDAPEMYGSSHGRIWRSGHRYLFLETPC
jgi:hypothetical protein